MGGGYSASDDGFVSCGRVEIPSYFSAGSPVPSMPWGPRALTYLLTYLG